MAGETPPATGETPKHKTPQERGKSALEGAHIKDYYETLDKLKEIEDELNRRREAKAAELPTSTPESTAPAPTPASTPESTPTSDPEPIPTPESTPVPESTEASAPEPEPAPASDPEPAQPSPRASASLSPNDYTIVDTRKEAKQKEKEEKAAAKLAEKEKEKAAKEALEKSKETRRENRKNAIEEAKKKKGATKYYRDKFVRGLKSLGIGIAVTGLLATPVIADIANNTQQNYGKSYEEDYGEDIQIKDKGIAKELEGVEGLVDGYDERGMYGDFEHKEYNEDFANAAEFAEECGYDARRMKVHTAKLQVESFADGLANLPERLQLKGFKNLTISEAETKLEGLSPELFVRTLRMFAHIIEMAEVEDIVLDGEYYNAFMNKKDPNGANTHDNLETVQCVTNENGTRAKRLVWRDEDGNEIGDMIVKINVDDMKNESDAIKRNSDRIVHLGNCTQVVRRKVGLKPKVYKGMKGIPRPTLVGEGNPEPTKGGIDHVTTPLTPGTPTPWGKTGDPNAEDEKNKVKYEGRVDPDSEVSEEENANTNIGKEGKSKIAPGVASSDTTKYGDVVTIYDDDSAVARVKGGDKQDTKPNGDNTEAPDGDPIIDEGGNYEQEKAQKEKDIKPGGNNHKDEAGIVERGGA